MSLTECFVTMIENFSKHRSENKLAILWFEEIDISQKINLTQIPFVGLDFEREEIGFKQAALEFFSNYQHYFQNHELLKKYPFSFFKSKQVCCEIAINLGSDNCPSWKNYIIEWLRVCYRINTDEEIKLFFREYHIDPEEQIKNVIFRNDNSNILKDEFKKPWAQSYIEQLTSWFIYRYNLNTAKSLTKQINNRERQSVGRQKKEKIYQKKSPLLAIFKIWEIYPITIFLMFVFVFISLVNINQLLDDILIYGNNFLISWNTFFSGNYNVPNYFSILITLASYLIIACSLYLAKRNPLTFKLKLPRLFGAIVVGYLPLLLGGKEVWKFGMNAQLPTIAMLVISCLFVSFLYLWHEVYNCIENKENVFFRVWKIYLRAVFYSILIGIIFQDIMGYTFYKIIDENIFTYYNNCLTGFIGVIDPKVLFIFFPLALLIGIFVQIIWEDKPITQPL